MTLLITFLGTNIESIDVSFRQFPNFARFGAETQQPSRADEINHKHFSISTKETRKTHIRRCLGAIVPPFRRRRRMEKKWKINICVNAFAMSTLNSSFNTQQYIYCFYFRCVHSFAFTLLRRSYHFDDMAFLHCVLTIRPVTVSIDLFYIDAVSFHSPFTLCANVSAQLTIFQFAFCSITFDGVRVASSHEPRWKFKYLIKFTAASVWVLMNWTVWGNKW